MSFSKSFLLFVVFITVAVVSIDAAVADNSETSGRKVYNKPSSINSSKDKDPFSSFSPANVLNQLDWRSLFSTALKLFFGNNDEEAQLASRQLVNMIISLIDSLRLSFTMKRSQARSIGEPEESFIPTTDAALAGLSMLKAYVKTITSEDQQCVKKYLCQANREAVKDGNKIGFMIAQFGSYATSYMLDNLRYSSFEGNFEAGKDGRSGVDCEIRYSQCNELGN
ncbi:hypothetical protein CHUAL_001940 [Chamberlinius hualienensis]